MSEPQGAPFERTVVVDKPGIVGARWWQESLSVADPVARRQAIQGILIATAAIAGLGAILALVASSGDSDTQTSSRDALEMQREYGWSFGAAEESLVFDGESLQPFDRAAL